MTMKFIPAEYYTYFCIFLIRVAGGIYTAVPWNTLLDWAATLNTNIETLSYVLTSRAIGCLAGTFLASFYMQIKHKFKLDPIIFYGIVTILSGVTAVFIPLAKELWLVHILMVIASIGYGALDTGLQSLIVETWGVTSSRPFVQGFHLTWSAGSVLGPYICAPFNQIDDDSDVCSSDSQASLNTTDVNDEGIPYIFWPWLISAVLYIIAGVLTIFVGFKGYRKMVQNKYSENKISESTNESTKISPDHYKFNFWRYDVWILLIVFILYMCIEGPEHWYADYVYTYGLCIHKLSIKLSSVLSSVFWGSLLLGRIVGIFVSNFIKPRTYFFIDVTAWLFSFAMLYIFNEPNLDENGNILSNDLNEIMLWVFTATSGFFYSTIFGAGVSWTAEFVDVTRGYAFVFGLGNQCGQLLGV